MICHKPHMASLICLRATIFQNPEGILWTHCIGLQYRLQLRYVSVVYDGANNSNSVADYDSSR
jgi:hypothetical protein